MAVHTKSSSRAAVKVDPDVQVWNTLLAYMRAHQPDICRAWFDQLETLGVSGGVLRIRAHSNTHRDFLQRQCARPFNDAAMTATGRLLTVAFLGPEDEYDASSGKATRTPTTPAPVGPAPLIPRPIASTIVPDHKLPPAPAIAPPPPAPSAPTVHPHDIPTPSTAAPNGGGYVPIEGYERLYDDGIELNPDYAFEHYVVGPGNRLAHAAALSIAELPGHTYNPFFVHGGVGLGKTHLLQAICLSIRQRNPKAVIYYTSCEGFMTQFMDAVAAGAMARFRHKFRHVDVLVVDDIHFLAKRDRTQEEFFHTFNSLHQMRKQVVLSSDAPPEEIPDLEERLVSRFKWGLVAPISAPDYETRVQILKNKARLRGFELPENVAQEVAQRINTNIRELDGAVVKLQMTATVEKRPIDLELVKVTMGEAKDKGEPSVQIQTIIDAVTDFFGVKMTDLQSKRRQRSIAMPRQLCMYLARRNTRFSLEEIGGWFGGRDHTTVLHAVRTIQDKCDLDGEFGQQVSAIETRLRGA